MTALLPQTIDGLNIRHHGDFHLGQMLVVKDDIFIIDFEGEPRRSLAERRRKAPAARDVAGLIRSIDYSATAALERALKVAPDEHGKLAAALSEWRDRAAAAFLAAYRETMGNHRLWPADPQAAERLLNFFLLEKAFYEIEYELAHRPDWLRVPLEGMLRISVSRPKRGLMTQLSAEAYAIVEGRHSDPFHYLGLHTEGDKTVVRAFLPEASNVEAVGEHGETATLARIHDAGLFAGALPNGSRRYQLRARFGDTVVDLDDPYRFPPVLTDFDLYLMGEGTHQRLYDKLGAHPMTLGRRRRRGVRGVRAQCAAGQRGRRFQFLECDCGIRCGCAASVIGNCSCRMPRPATTTNSILSARRASICRSSPTRWHSLPKCARARHPSCWTRPNCRIPARRPTTSTRSAHRCRSTRSISAHGGARTAMSG